MFQSVLFSSPKTNSKLKYFSYKSIFCLYSDHLSRVLKLKLRMISCDLFFFRFKNTWQFSVPVLRKLHYEVMKDYISKATYFLTVCPKKGCLKATRGLSVGWSWLSSGAHLWPSSDNCVLWLTQEHRTHSPLSRFRKEQDKYLRLRLSDAVCFLKRAERKLRES